MFLGSDGICGGGLFSSFGVSDIVGVGFGFAGFLGDWVEDREVGWDGSSGELFGLWSRWTDNIKKNTKQNKIKKRNFLAIL